MTIVKKSTQYAFAVVTGTSTVASLCNYTLRDIEGISFWHSVLILIGSYVILWGIIYFWYFRERHKPYTTKINGKHVQICIGDIFKERGLKVIPFNERFDTQVDDIIIAHRTLNGMMIDNFVSNIEDLRQTIANAIKAVRLSPHGEVKRNRLLVEMLRDKYGLKFDVDQSRSSYNGM